ncbi:MAG: TAXI family TRAP transporter solute-binding subunit [Bacillota bacterium]
MVEKRRVIGLLAVGLVFCLVFLLSGCGGGNSQSASPRAGESSKAPAAGSAKYVSLAGGMTGGTYNVLSSGMSQVISKHVPGLSVTAEVTSGSTENMKSLTRGDLDLGFATVDSAYYARLGEREFTDKGDIEMVMAGYDMWNHVFVRKDSGIKSIEELKGKTIGSNPGVQAQYYTPSILQAYGLKAGDYKLRFLSHVELADALRDKNIDAILQLGGVPTAPYTDLATTTDLVALPIDSVHLKELQKVAPYFERAILKAGSYRGIDQDVEGVSVRVGVFARKNVDKAVVYDMVKAIFEHTDELKQIHPLGATFTAENLAAAAKEGLVPIHEGAIQYLKERGLL